MHKWASKWRTLHWVVQRFEAFLREKNNACLACKARQILYTARPSLRYIVIHCSPNCALHGCFRQDVYALPSLLPAACQRQKWYCDELQNGSFAALSIVAAFPRRVYTFDSNRRAQHGSFAQLKSYFQKKGRFHHSKEQLCCFENTRNFKKILCWVPALKKLDGAHSSAYLSMCHPIVARYSCPMHTMHI